MMDIVDVRQTTDYQSMLDDCKRVYTGVYDASWKLVLAHYRLGQTLRDYEQRGVFTRQRGDATVTSLADDLQTSVSVLYRDLQLVDEFPTVEDLQTYKLKTEQGGHTCNISYIKAHALPSPQKQPEKYGGKVAVADSMMSELESMAIKTEHLKKMVMDVTLPIETRREVAGVVIKAQEEVVAAAADIMPDYKSVLDATATYMDDGEERYKAYIMSLSCTICGKEGDYIQTHEQVKLLDLDEQYLSLPYCTEHYQDYQERGFEKFQEWHGLVIMKCIIRALVGYILLFESRGIDNGNH